jgi:hypothetical protein
MSAGALFGTGAENQARRRRPIPDNIVSQRLIAPFGKPAPNYASHVMIAGAVKFGDPLLC